MATKCPHCGSERVELRASVGGTGKRFRCDSCLKAWTTGTGSRSGRSGGARGSSRNPGFPSTAVLTPEEAQERFEMLLSAHARAGATATDTERTWREEMRAKLARDAIATAGLPVFKEIATSKNVATTGPQTAFYKELNKLGDDEGGRKARETAEFLLYGDDGSLSERLTALIGGERGMPGFREALLTKILAIAEPTKFLPILTAKGKAAFVQHIWGVRLELDKKQTAGDQVVATNDALVERLAPTFPDLLDAAAFLWWSQTHP